MCKSATLWIFIAMISLSACSQAGSNPQQNAVEPEALADIQFAPTAAALAQEVGQSSSDQRTTSPIDTHPQQRIIIKNATLTLTTADPAAKINEITTFAESIGGWVVSSTATVFTNSAGEQVTRGSIIVRVPAEHLTQSMDRIKENTVRVDAENITGQDVTQDYVDITSRLNNLKSSEAQLQTIMSRAETVEDVLAVQSELTIVRSEIEVLQGRINYFDEAAAFSSIRVDLNPPAPGPVQTQSSSWNPGRTVENAISTLIQLLQVTIDFGISVIILSLPFLLIFGIPAWMFWKRRRDRHALSTPITQSNTD